MRGLMSLATIAIAAYVQGRKQGRIEGHTAGISQMATAFAAGVKSGDQ